MKLAWLMMLLISQILYSALNENRRFVTPLVPQKSSVLVTFQAWPLVMWSGTFPDEYIEPVENSAPHLLARSTHLSRGSEPCDTLQSIPHATVLEPGDPWEEMMTTQAVPGDVFLLRAGIYQAVDKLWLSAGTAGAPILIKPFNCEDVRLQTSIRPNSYTTIADLTIEAVGIEDIKWTIRFDGKNSGAITDVVVRNSTILGGEIDAIRMSGDVRNITIQGNHIDGGQSGHNIFVTAETTVTPPNQILITQNHLTKHHFESAAEDMFQVRDVGLVQFTYNSCSGGYNMEQCVDIKNAKEPLLIAHNFFDGNTLHQTGGGEDGSGGCMVIHEDDGQPEQHIIESNYFYHCKGTVIRFAPGHQAEESSAIVRYNLLIQEDNRNSVIPIEAATNVVFSHNTIIGGLLRGHLKIPVWYNRQREKRLEIPNRRNTLSHKASRYPSDLSDEEWMILKPLLPLKQKGAGRPVELDMRQVMNAIFYVLRTGCQWAYLPERYPNHNSVYYHYRKWCTDGT